MKEALIWLLGIFVLIVLISGGIGFLMWAFPTYNVWTQNMKGQANLRQQEWEKRILVEQAQAEKDAATLKAQAEIERAKGVAEANQIIGDSLKENDDYIRYLWVQSLSDETNSIIYIPTEANLPILEASRLP